MKTFFALFVFAMVAVASGRQVAPKNIVDLILCDIITDMWEDNKDKVAEVGADYVDLGPYGALEDLKFFGLNNMIIDNLICDQMTVTAEISLLTGTATAGLKNMNADLTDGLDTIISGDGVMSTSADILKLAVTFSVEFTDTLGIIVKKYSDVSTSAQSMKTKVVGVDNFEQVTDSLNKNLLFWLNENLAGLIQKCEPVILPVINEILAKINIEGSEA